MQERPLKMTCGRCNQRPAVRLAIDLRTWDDVPFCGHCMSLYGIIGRPLPMVQVTQLEQEAERARG